MNIDDDVLVVARALAKRRSCSLGSALSELARRGFKWTGDDRDGMAFVVAPDADPITSADVYGALDGWP